MASPRGFGSASAVVLWAALKAGRRVSGGLHGAMGSAPAALPVRPVLGGLEEQGEAHRSGQPSGGVLLRA